MRRKRKAIRNDTPFAKWLFIQIEVHDTTVTDLSLKAGLSSGTLRGILVTPDRQPSLDTCLRLARALDIPHEEVCQIAGLTAPLPNDPQLIDPDRAVLAQLYGTMPVPVQRAMAGLIQTLLDHIESIQEEKKLQTL